MEVLGLVIGVVALLPPAIEAWHTCADLLHSCQKYTKDVRKTEEKLLIQRKLFNRECRLLLECIVKPPSLADAMMASGAHAEWRSKGFKTRWERIMGDAFDVPVRHVLDTLTGIEVELRKMEGTALGRVDEHGNPMNSSKALRRKRARAMAQKVDWILSGKTRLQAAIGELRVQVEDLARLRRQTPAFEKRWLVQAQGEKEEEVEVKKEKKALSAKILEVRDQAKGLLGELAERAVCECHEVNFRLAGPEEGEEEGEKVKFRLMVTRDLKNVENSHECTSLVVHSATVPEERSDTKGKPAKTPSFKLEKATTNTSSPTSSFNISSRASSFKAGTSKVTAGKGRIRFADVDEEESDNESVTPPPSYAASTNKPQPITNLCNTLSLARQQSLPPTHCLGSIPSTPPTHYLLYPGPPTYPTLLRVSLEDIFSRPAADKHLFLPRDERLKIALTLALSLLQFGSYSTSWFQERWRSRDVFFFLDSAGNLASSDRESSLGMEPYIAPFKPNMPASPPPTPSQPHGLARNEQLYSLALVLIEIAFGDSLFSIHNQEMPSPDSVDEFAEYLRAKRVLMARLSREMGAKYADVVKRCFFCDFGLGEDDFSRKELQYVFYESVVRRLEECWRAFVEV